MIIGIDASRAFQKNRTGIEEYSYQVIKHLMNKLDRHEVVLYVKKNQESRIKNQEFLVPDNWNIKIIKFPYLWTQLGLSLKMLLRPVDVLFIPAHTVPLIHPKNTIVTIHGLEYEFVPQAYSFWARFYMRFFIKKSCRWAKKIIAVSENTKKDLVSLYEVPGDKIEVIYEGYEKNLSFRAERSVVEESNLKILSRSLYFGRDDNFKYVLFIGRLEERKNIVGIIKAFEILKEQYGTPHRLILAGKHGFGYKKVMSYLSNSFYASDIIQTGFVNEEEKRELLKNADVFLFPTFYEGFGLPILEAQSVGVPVVAGNNSSIPEIVNNCHSERNERAKRENEVEESNLDASRSLGYARDDKFSVILVDPNNVEEIAKAAYKLISDKNLRDDIIKKGLENVKRFSWDKCASEIKAVILSEA